MSTLLSDVREMRSLTRGSELQATEAGPSRGEEPYHPGWDKNIRWKQRHSLDLEVSCHVSSWMFFGSLFLFFREPTRWEKLQRSIYLSEAVPKVVVPRSRTDLVKQCTRGVLRKKQGVLLFNRNQCFFPSPWCPWCGARLRAGGEGGDRGWDGWMASPTQCAWVWASSGK